MTQVIERLNAAANAHDIDAFVACFAPDYDSVQPAHPDRAFGGREQVRENWSAMFTGIPDFRSELLRVVEGGDTVWSEWHWQGTGLDMAGVMIMGIRDDQIAWARLFMERVEHGEGIKAVVRDLSGT